MNLDSPELPEESQRDPYQLVETSPRRNRALEEESVKATLAASAAAFPQRRRAEPVMEEADDEFSFFYDRILPVLLIAAGLGLRVAVFPMEHGRGAASIPATIALGFCQMVLTAAIMLGGVYLSARIQEANFGRLDSAILKLCAIAIFIWAAGTFAMALGNYHPEVARFAICLMFFVQIALFATLFKLELQELIVTAAICALLEAGAAVVMFL